MFCQLFKNVPLNFQNQLNEKRTEKIDDIIKFLDPTGFKKITMDLSGSNEIRNQLQKVAKELDGIRNDILLLKDLENHWVMLLQILQKALGFSLLKENNWKTLFKEIFDGIVAPFR